MSEEIPNHEFDVKVFSDEPLGPSAATLACIRLAEKYLQGHYTILPKDPEALECSTEHGFTSLGYDFVALDEGLNGFQLSWYSEILLLRETVVEIFSRLSKRLPNVKLTVHLRNSEVDYFMFFKNGEYTWTKGFVGYAWPENVWGEEE